MEIDIPRDEEMRLRVEIEKRSDPEATRIRRYLDMPDLARIPGSPLSSMVERVKALPVFDGFDDINIPEIIPTSILFDLFNFPADHPARKKSDTYFVNDQNALRTHDTVFWYYYLNHPEIQARVARRESVGALCYGKVYRKDEIDRRHMNIFHQMGGWFIQPDSKGILSLDDLKNALSEVVKSVFGEEVEYRFLDDVFPYTDPSLQIEIKKGDQWIEVLGDGMPKKAVLQNMEVTGYNGWAFGFGLERLAIISMQLPDIRLLWSEDERVKRQLVLGQPFKEVSKYPAVMRDISFVVKKGFIPNDYFDLVRDIGGELIEEVALIDTYENAEKLGAGNESYAYRITYRSVDRTLTNEEVNALHKKLEDATKKQFSATIR